MQAIIVAGGRGERLKPITNEIPKPMVEVGGKSILERTIDLLRGAGISDLIIALCYLPEKITEYFGDGRKFGVNIHYTYEDPAEPMGTAGAIMGSKGFIAGDFVVTYSDIIRKLNVKEMTDQHQRRLPLATINVYKRKSDGAKSMVIFDKDGEVSVFKERPTSEDVKSSFVWSNGSFYVFSPEIFEYIKKDGRCDFGKDVFPLLLASNRTVNVFGTEDYFIDIGTLEKLEEAKKYFSL